MPETIKTLSLLLGGVALISVATSTLLPDPASWIVSAILGGIWGYIVARRFNKRLWPDDTPTVSSYTVGTVDPELTRFFKDSE